MDRLDARKTWPAGWPILEYKEAAEDRRAHGKICSAALYWAVKRLSADLLAEVASGKLVV